MKKILKVLGFLVLLLLLIVAAFYVGMHIHFSIKNSRARALLLEKKTLDLNGQQIRDLNNNGEVDVYEDPQRPVASRVEDLLKQMTIEEKVGLMFHPPMGIGKEGEILSKPNIGAFFLGSTYDYLINDKLRTFNLFSIPDPEAHAQWYNGIQKIAEQDRLGIPVTISSDPRHGLNNFIGNNMLNGYFSQWPEPLGLAATDDSLLVVEFGKIAATELRALGIRVALHPMADLATEPRWARINGTFGEDAKLSAKMMAAYIYGFQGEHLDHNSVACMTKHWPGGGPQEDGWDAHFRYGKDQVYPGGNFNYHLRPFEAAFAAGTAMIMPYYGIPKDQTSENVGMSFNRDIIQLLRNKYQFDGIVCTDWGIIESFKFLGFTLFEGPGWGVDELSPKQRIEKAIDAGIDQFGGNNNTEELLASVKDGTIKESRIDESVRRILKNKFELGLFDNPYVDVVAAGEIVGKPTFVEKGKIAQRKSVVLLKNSPTDQEILLPLSQKSKVYLENVDAKVAAQYSEVVATPEQATHAIIRLNAPFEKRDGNMMESFFHQGRLDFAPDEIERIQKMARQIPTIICIYLDRPAVFPEINEFAAAVLGDFGASDDAVLDIVFGKFNPSAKLPFELPSSMQAVEDQKEDVPHDSQNPLYPFGHGLTFESDTLMTLN